MEVFRPLQCHDRAWRLVDSAALACLPTQYPRPLLPEVILDEIHMFRYDFRFTPLLPILVFLRPAHVGGSPTSGILTSSFLTSSFLTSSLSASSGSAVALFRLRLRQLLRLALFGPGFRLCMRVPSRARCTFRRQARLTVCLSR